MNKLYQVGLWIALTFMIAPAVVWGANGSVVIFDIPDTVLVNGPQLCFNDLGTIREGQDGASAYLKEVELGNAPAPGQVRIFNREYLSSIIRQYHLPLAIDIQMSDQVTVRSAAACVRRADIEQAIESLLVTKKPHLIKKWVELYNIPETTWLAQGEWKIDALPVGNLPEVGNALFKVILAKGNDSRVLNISGKIKATALVYRAVRNIPYRGLVKKDDFELIEMELENSKELLADFPSQMRTIKSVKEGEVLRSDWFQPVPLVAKDQEVKVTVKDENVAVNIIGIAKSDGWLGDQILIINPASYKTFKARVTGNGIVELNI